MLDTLIDDIAPAARFSEALAWRDDSIVARYCADHGESPERGAACFTAFKQFMVLCAASDEELAPSEPIDDMWHTALLFTRSYRAFCQEQLQTFVHHLPLDQPADAEVYGKTRRRAEKAFGKLDPDWWSSVEAAANCGGCASIYQP
jgi:hypothetical protein